MKKIFLRKNLLLVCLILAGLAFTQCSNKDAEIRAAMEKEAVIINEKCPVALTDNMRLDRCEVVAPKTFQYHYTITADDKSNVELKSMMEAQKPSMVEMISNQLTMKPYRDADVIFQYLYKNAKGEDIHTINIAPQDYK